MKSLKFFIVIFISLMFGACSANWHIKKAEQKCPECFQLDTIVNETVLFTLDTIVNVDTTINIVLPRDTVRIEKPIPITRNFDKVIKKDGIITTEVEAIKGKLFVKSFINDSSMFYNLKMQIHLKDAIIIEKNKIILQKDVIIQEQKDWIKWLKIGLVSLLVLICLGVVFKILNLFKK